jgi:hypothetical protein
MILLAGGFFKGASLVPLTEFLHFKKKKKKVNERVKKKEEEEK